MENNKYNNGKVYKIEPICDYPEGDIYIGSSCEKYLSNRMARHRADYKKWQNGKADYVTSYDIFNKYDIENCQILLLESVNAKSKEELRAREGYYIKNMKCVNKNIAGRTLKEYEKDNKEKIAERKKKYKQENKDKVAERIKKYEQANKEKIAERRKKYEENNKDKIAETKRKYRLENKELLAEKTKIYEQNNKEKIAERKKQYEEENKEKISERKKQYRLENKERIAERGAEKITCECGSICGRGEFSKHKKTQKHLNFIGNNNLNTSNEHSENADNVPTISNTND